jgi:hypothetical protein
VLTDVKEDSVGLVTINRPKALNALNQTVMNEIIAALKEFDKDDSIGCMVLTGSQKAFAGIVMFFWPFVPHPSVHPSLGPFHSLHFVLALVWTAGADIKEMMDLSFMDVHYANLYGQIRELDDVRYLLSLSLDDHLTPYDHLICMHLKKDLKIHPC